MTSQLELRNHTIEPVWGLSPVLQQKEMALKVRLIRCAHEVGKHGKITTHHSA
jgi:hypothetical protein